MDGLTFFQQSYFMPSLNVKKKKKKIRYFDKDILAFGVDNMDIFRSKLHS